MCQNCSQVLTCVGQSLLRILLSVVLMLENLVRMILQTIYNLLSMLLQLCSLLPICLMFCMTTQLKGCMFSGGGYSGQGGGIARCLLSLLAFLVFLWLLAKFGILQKIFKYFGYIPDTTEKHDESESDYDDTPARRNEESWIPMHIRNFRSKHPRPKYRKMVNPHPRSNRNASNYDNKPDKSEANETNWTNETDSTNKADWINDTDWTNETEWIKEKDWTNETNRNNYTTWILNETSWTPYTWSNESYRLNDSVAYFLL